MDDKQIWQHEARFGCQVHWLAMLRQCCWCFPHVGPERASTKRLLQKNTYSDTRVLSGRVKHPSSLPPYSVTFFTVRQAASHSRHRIIWRKGHLLSQPIAPLHLHLSIPETEGRWWVSSQAMWLQLPCYLTVSFHIIFLYFSFDSCFHMKNEKLSLLTQAEEVEEHFKSNLSYGSSMYTFQLWQQTWKQSVIALLIT